MYAILSIKPKYCSAIESGVKRFEFRRRIFKENERIRSVYIYSTSPVKKVVGQFQIGGIVSGSPQEVWNACKDAAGIDELEFHRYFSGSNIAYAISIEELEFFEPIDPAEIIDGFHAPQSFCYVNTPLS